MPRQNRVTPFGAIEADPARGLFMGNRGILHDENGKLGRAGWRHKAWICCLTAFKGRQRSLMAPNRYTELFFCDEAVALAAGHRPCAECRRADFLRFRDSWRRAQGLAPDASLRVGEIDGILHAARVDRDRQPLRYAADATDLPDGAFVILPDGPNGAWLVRRGRLRRWRHAGYVQERSLPAAMVAVMTPEPLVAALRAGYEPAVHPSADETPRHVRQVTAPARPS